MKKLTIRTLVVLIIAFATYFVMSGNTIPKSKEKLTSDLILPSSVTFRNAGYGNKSLTIYMENDNGYYVAVGSYLILEDDAISIDFGNDFITNYGYSVDGGDIQGIYSTYINLY